MYLGLLFLLSALPFFQCHCGQCRLLQLNDKAVVEVWDKVVVEVVGHGGKREHVSKMKMLAWILGSATTCPQML